MTRLKKGFNDCHDSRRILVIKWEKNIEVNRRFLSVKRTSNRKKSPIDFDVFFPFNNQNSSRIMTIIKSFFQASHPKKKIYLGIIVFLCVVIWMILLTQGMPFYDPDDWDHVLISDDTPWKLMIQNFITPWSTSENWVAQASMMDQVRNKRVFLGIVLKSITGVFGYKFFPYYLFSKVLFFAGTITLLFLILVSLNSSYRYAITGALFYLLVPANYLHALWISVPETMAHFFILLSVYLYLNLGISLDQGNLKFSYWRTLGFLFIAGWFAMKTKETAVILPLML